MVHRKKALALGLFLVTGVMQANSVKYKVQNYMNQLPALSSALLNAAYNGNLSGVQEAIKSGADIIARDYYHNTAIMIARDRGYGEIVTYLNQQALFSGANRGDLPMVRNAIMGGADINARDHGETATEIARRIGYGGIVQFLTKVMQANREWNREWMRVESEENVVQDYMNHLPPLSSALLNAADKGDLSGVQKAIEKGADIIAHGYHGYTAAEIARDRGYGEIVTYLNQQALFSGANRGDMNMVRNAIMGGADKNARDYNGKTAAEIAFRKHYYGIVSLLSRPLLDAAYRGDLAGVKAALADGAYINALDNYNNTAIMIARDRGHAAVAEYLKDVALSVMGTPKNTTSEKKLLK